MILIKLVILFSIIATSTCVTFTDNTPIYSRHKFQFGKEKISSMNDANQVEKYFGNHVKQVANYEQISSMMSELYHLTNASIPTVKIIKYKFEVSYGLSGVRFLEVNIGFEDGQYTTNTFYSDISVNIIQEYKKEKKCKRKYKRVFGAKIWRKTNCQNILVPIALTDKDIEKIKVHLDNKLLSLIQLR